MPEDIEPEYIDAEDPEVRTGGTWMVTNPTSLDWALSRLADLERQVADIAAQEADAHARITVRAEKLRAKAACGVAFFSSHIQRYAHSNRPALLGGGKKKSRELLSGVVGWRAMQGKLVVEDKKALEKWLMQQPPESGLYRTDVKPNMEALKALHAEKGTIPPGCIWVDGDEWGTFYMEPQPPVTALAVKGSDDE